MDISVLSNLEYIKIREMLAERTGSIMGRELAEQLVPASDYAEVEIRLSETAEAVDIMNNQTSIPLGGIRDIRATAKRAELGAVLEPNELLSVSSTLYSARRIKVFIADLPMSIPILKGWAANISVLRPLENSLEGILTEQGTIRDDASSELLKIRREIKQAQNRVKEKLDTILRSGEYQKYFQDALVTMRGDRYVIPIKQEYRQHFPGIVHDQSASGATLFIEPIAVVNLNNDIKQFMAAEKAEIERILIVISGQIAKDAPLIQENCKILAQLDFVFAKAKLSIEMHSQRPTINAQGYINLLQARHPLIPADKVVPIDVNLGGPFHTLLITGPNTGGKTVTLKTVGLFALMTQAGLFISTAPDSQMPVFKNIFADIGDEQSIEQSLSTFSAHMSNLVRILARTTADDLVLIDEIGAGTDPSEGAALAMSMLEYIHQIGARTIATTHYSELKTFAYTRHGIENASVEFDIQTLRPTYRLLIGIPGSSNAFAISKRLGLSDLIIERAKQLIHKEHAEFETVLSALEEQKRAYTAKLQEVNHLEQDVRVLQDRLQLEERRLVDQKNSLLRKAHDEAAALLRQARREAEEIIGNLKAQFFAQSNRERQNAIDSARKQLRNISDQVNITGVYDEKELPELKSAAVKPGMHVYITSLQQKGEVIALNGDDATVQLGILKLTVPLSECRLVDQPGNIVPAKSRTRVIPIQSAARQIDIRGMTIEEAENILDRYIDDALLAGLPEVLIIHGKGTGALRKGVKSYLAGHPRVQEIKIAELNEGGTGATVVRLT
ncbi:MAG TPA: endonuclease MutS2 [Methylomusa anaerophila]|uniref:Endonuclease MutS2 n=1 Tax=Methylomusa anaerophila TaxID=1930071 RepID=A0A348AP46_9FIRM|nr:endonuclease MutS2 [Methylomusa anaerophila]BBB92844.1 endonuclease MutS2 [Methylomusa anaerophila]HML87317.1 endonuclease MutS2 [Methylomusa anaerophila]